MARAFDACMVDLTASGVDQEKARRACMAGFWAANGMFPEQADEAGLELGGDCSDYAYYSIAEMSAGSERPGNVFFGSAQLTEVKDAGVLQSFAFDVKDKEEQSSLLVQAQMLAPGTLIDATGKEFTFTEDDMLAYRDNFNPLNHPPILLDHELSAKATIGRLRALRVNEAAGYVLMGLWEILGAENVAPVKDKRWSRTSGRFVQSKDRLQKVVIEGSVVWSGAYDRGFGDRAQILLGSTKGRNTMSDTQKKEASAPKLEDQLAAVLSKLTDVAGKVDAMETKMAEREKAVSESVAELATATASTETGQDLSAENPIVANLQKEVDELKLARAKDLETAELQKSANQVLDLIKCGKSRPEWQEQELAVLHGMPAALRPKYLELRNQMPNAWPEGPRQSVVLAKAPASVDEQKKEQEEYATLGAGQGFAPKKEGK